MRILRRFLKKNTYICILKHLNPALKLGFSVQDKHLNMCVQVENSKGTLCIRKTVFKIKHSNHMISFIYTIQGVYNICV